MGYFWIEISGHIKLGVNRTNITCLVEIKENRTAHNSLPLDYKWIIFPESLTTVSYIFMFSAAIEFVCAQSPYSMKGLIAGLALEFQGLLVILDFLVLSPLTLTVHKWPPVWDMVSSISKYCTTDYVHISLYSDSDVQEETKGRYAT